MASPTGCANRNCPLFDVAGRVPYFAFIHAMYAAHSATLQSSASGPAPVWSYTCWLCAAR